MKGHAWKDTGGLEMVRGRQTDMLVLIFLREAAVASVSGGGSGQEIEVFL